MAGDDGERPIIIKKVVKGGGGHHGGAWEVAYADFVTAVMAVFLLLWLLNVSTEEARNAISNYFDPTAPQVADTQSGAGGVLGGLTMATEGAMVSDVQPIVTPQMPETTRKPFGGQEAERPPPTAQEVEKALEAARAQGDARFKAAEEALRQAIAESPELKALAENLLIDVTPEGLRIQIVDREGGAMFPLGQRADAGQGAQADRADLGRGAGHAQRDIGARAHRLGRLRRRRALHELGAVGRPGERDAAGPAGRGDGCRAPEQRDGQGRPGELGGR